jgi:hypothetical protein
MRICLHVHAHTTKYEQILWYTAIDKSLCVRVYMYIHVCIHVYTHGYYSINQTYTRMDITVSIKPKHS